MNKHKYLDSDGKHAIGGNLTGWIFTDAVRQVSCPKCGSGAGYICETPKGRKAWPPHNDRVSTLSVQNLTVTKK
jgi:protein-disulfide isomerase